MDLYQFMQKLIDQNRIRDMMNSAHFHSSPGMAYHGWPSSVLWYSGFDEVRDTEEVVPEHSILAVKQHGYTLFKGLVWDSSGDASCSVVFVGKDPSYSLTAELPSPRYVA